MPGQPLDGGTGNSFVPSLEDGDAGFSGSATQINLSAERSIFHLILRLRIVETPVGTADLKDFLLADRLGAGGFGDRVEGVKRLANRH